MKTNVELGVIGAASALYVGGNKMIAVDKNHPTWNQDEVARTAFAAAVANEVRKERQPEYQTSEVVAKRRENTQAESVKMAQSQEINNLKESLISVEEESSARAATWQEKWDDFQTRWEVERKGLYAAKAELESKLAIAEQRLIALEWRSTSVKPTRADGNYAGIVSILDHDGNMSTIAYTLWDRLGPEWKWWRPSINPPEPTAEEKEREEFETWAADKPHLALNRTNGISLKEYNSSTTQTAWIAWQAARASKEVKA